MAETPHDPLLRNGWRSLLILAGAWAAPALMVTGVLYAIQFGSEGGESLVTTLLRSLWFYGQLAVLCPLVYWLQQRLSFSRGHWPIATAAYLGSAALVVVALMALSGVANWVFGYGDGPTLLELIRREFATQQGQFQAIVYLFYFAMIVGSMMIVRLHRKSQFEAERATALALEASRLETQVTVARLKALESQLNPHFLFNALNSIASLVQQRRSDQAYDAIAILGELLRETIHEGDRHTISLSRELQLLERYLDLERIRFSDRLQASVDVEEGCSEAAVPAMILQPLVENALRHGIAVLPEAGRVEVDIRRDGVWVIVEVRDDGPGLPDGWCLKSSAGVGLQNLRDRLAAHFDDEFEFSLEPALPRGTAARIALPYRAFREASP